MGVPRQVRNRPLRVAARDGVAASRPVLAGDPRSRLELLPVPSAIVVMRDGRPLVLAQNRELEAIGTLVPGDPPVEAAAALLSGEAQRDRLAWRCGDAVAGRQFDVHLGRAPLIEGGEACLVTLIDRTAEYEGVRSLQAELAHDSLTGLPNRVAFAEAVDELVAGGGRLAVLLVDLARFGRINQSLGPMTGDEVIITVARRLLSTLRAGDLIARIGGNEFGLLVNIAEDGAREAEAAAKRIRAALEAPFRLSRYEVGIDCAIGCAIPCPENESGEELLRRAQLALRQAKDSGRFEILKTAGSERTRHVLDIETELRRAIDRSELSLAFQPIMSLADDRILGFEALARWNHPLRGPIAPDEFIAVAEETGLIVPLGRWALRAALATLAQWDAAAGRTLPITMSVNFSATQFARDDVPQLVAGALIDAGVSGERLTAELTESAIVTDPDRIMRAMQALKGLDVRIAMDDFGTGYSNLAHLRRLPIDILKIDRSFVADMLLDRDKLAIVRAVLGLADALGKSTTAEGIESADVARTLGALGCRAGQGYLYARPLTDDAAFAMVGAT